ncbi:hypothetical protein [Paenibacillus apiarius]|uniref:hypothetical protein n=1 Tax=Paenibacillus apiarius TaxID=46240 RepID=UPI003B3B8AE2
MGIHKIGEKVRTNQRHFLRDNGDVVTKICPQIQVNLRWCYLVDRDNESEIVECETRYEARKIAMQAREKATKKQDLPDGKFPIYSLEVVDDA